MNKISKEKRNHLIIAAVVVVVVVGGLYWGLIGPQYQSLAKIASEKESKVAELQRHRNATKLAMENAAQYKQIEEQLAQGESDVATGDYYAWIYDLIRRFKANYKVEIPTITEPTISDVDVVPHFPYRQVKLSATGQGYYHDLGRFIADFENAYPHIRVTNLSMEPSGTGNGASGEKLTFHFDIVALVKANS